MDAPGPTDRTVVIDGRTLTVRPAGEEWDVLLHETRLGGLIGTSVGGITEYAARPATWSDLDGAGSAVAGGESADWRETLRWLAIVESLPRL